MLNELEIKQNCNINRYNYKYFNEVAIITTGQDIWTLESVDVFDKTISDYKQIIKVRHLNKAGNKKGKSHFHTQRYAQDIDYIFNNIIVPHEQANRVFQKTFRIKKILTNYI